MIVVDTNVLAYAVRPGEHTEAALRARRRDADWVAPPFWRLELLNVLAVAQRVEGLDADAALAAFAAADDLVRDLNFSPAPEATLRLTQRASISAYDAQFALAADRLGVPLVTADRRLAQRVPDLAVSLSEFATEPG